MAVGMVFDVSNSMIDKLPTTAISTRIKELQTTISEGVVSAEIRWRSWRVQVLQGQVDQMLKTPGGAGADVR